MFKSSRKKRGSALLLVIVTMAVLMVLGTALLTISVAETRHGIQHEHTTQAHYISVSGAESMARYLLDNQNSIVVKPIITSLEAGGSYPSSGNFSNGTYDVVVTGQSNYLFVTSKGTISDRYERTNTLILSNSYPPPGFGTYAVAAKTIIEAAGGSFTINGNIASNGPQALSDSQLNNVSGNTDFNQNLGFPTVVYPFNEGEHGITLTDLANPVTGDYFFDNGTHYRIPANSQGDAISIGGNSTLTFNTGSAGDEMYIVLDGGLSQTGNSIMIFNGGGKVYLYVDGSINCTGGAWLQNTFAGDVIFYVPKDPPDDPARSITFSGNTSYTAFIIAPNVDMTYNGGGSESFSGQAWVNYFNGHGSFTIIQDPISEGDVNEFVNWPWSMHRWQ